MESRESFLPRVDPKSFLELERWAAGELRSVHGQVEWILREAIRHRTVSIGIPPARCKPPSGSSGMGS